MLLKDVVTELVGTADLAQYLAVMSFLHVSRSRRVSGGRRKSASSGVARIRQGRFRS